MEVTVQIPDSIGRRFEIPRWLLEKAGLEAFRSGEITTAELRELLGFETRMEVDAFLKRHGVAQYTIEDLAADRQTLDRALAE